MNKALLLPWAVLSVATLVSWWLDASIDGAWVGIVILLVAFFKARVVLMHFMQVRAAPAAVRWCCEVWVVVACSSLISLLGISAARSSPPGEAADAAIAAKTSEVDASELRCLALSMYWEAKAEGRDGMLAVGHVVLNRVEHSQFPNSPCAVVFDGGETPPCQFSWYCDGKSDHPTEVANWAHAQKLARQLMTDKMTDTTRGALFFHGKQIKNPWRVPRTKTVTVGNHVFYKL